MALVLNARVLEWVFSPDRNLEAGALLLCIGVGQAALFLLGVGSILGQPGVIARVCLRVAALRPKGTAGRRVALVGNGTFQILLVAFGAFAYIRSEAPETAYFGDEPLSIPYGFDALEDNAGGLIVAELQGSPPLEIVLGARGRVAAFGANQGRLWLRELDIHLTANGPPHDRLPGVHAPAIVAADIDGDGRDEVFTLTGSNELAILNGVDGALIRRIQLCTPPAGDHWEHLAIADLSGNGQESVLLQATEPSGTRMGLHVAAYEIQSLLRNPTAPPLWTTSKFPSLAHGGLRVADLDDDGRDELVGAGIVGHDGTVLVGLPVRGHIDAVSWGDVRPDVEGLEVVALEEGGGPDGNRVFLFGLDGVLWESGYRGWEPQNTVVGEFDLSASGLEMWCRSRFEVAQRPFVIGSTGDSFGHYRMLDVSPRGWTIKGLEVITRIDWTGEVKQLAVAKERHSSGDVAIFDPMTGSFLLRFEEDAERLFVADVLGDWREEIIVARRQELHIYANSAPNPRPELPSLWANRNYRREKTTWNYYSP